ncbi:unnamed protein product [Acanthoscelides obtectus]|uniref:Uncharacterized protein n=1 Tax=Acanthoscelides obtectus TaxID=200917 RepID=A0A9P0PL22_ACAOB|nr:unnamed protein product [Acanthoscelides obtectus]CAK1624050.1 hypothetical protein AOBTE_LOCUS2308 [Acanthoscelides obtectus]
MSAEISTNEAVSAEHNDMIEGEPRSSGGWTDTSSTEDELSEPFGSGGSEADPDFFPNDLSDSEIDEPLDVSRKQKQKRSVQFPCQTQKISRKRKTDKSEWQKNKAKRLGYESARTIKQSDGTTKRIKVEREEKKIKPACGEKCRLKCSMKISEEARKQIFQQFWAMGDLQRQREFISRGMVSVQPKYRYYVKLEGSRRLNQAYYLNVDSQNIRVCKHGKHSTVPETIKDGIRDHINTKNT